MKKMGVTVLVLMATILASCQQATAPGSQATSNTGPVQGTINGKSFTTVAAVATASKSKTNAYDVTLTTSSATPSVLFTIDASPKTYTVTTLGINGLNVTAYLGGTDFITFDSGSVTIHAVDLTSKQIKGTFNGVKTTDDQSSLNGEFSATIP